MLKSTGILGVVLSAFVFSLAPQLALAANKKILVEGSTTVIPIVSRAAERYRALHPKVRILTKAGGSGVGAHAAGTKRADIGMTSRQLTPHELDRYKSAKLRTHVLGKDAVAPVVSSEIYRAGVRSLSKKQIGDIYLGKIINWKEVGGPDRPIVVIDKERHRGTRHVFMEYILGNAEARAPGARLVTGSNNEEQTKIAQSDSAIGMLSFAWLNHEVRGLALRDGDRVIEPNLGSVRDGTFPIARNLNLVTAGPPNGEVKGFIEFLLGPEGQKIVEESGYISMTETHR